LNVETMPPSRRRRHNLRPTQMPITTRTNPLTTDMMMLMGFSTAVPSMR
jgi:hypothetical protein